MIYYFCNYSPKLITITQIIKPHQFYIKNPLSKNLRMLQSKNTLQAFGLGEKLIPIAQIIPQPDYGEVLICNKQSNGALDPIFQSRGKQILNISGGKKKIFLFEEVNQQEHIVTAIHPENQDFLQFNGQQTLPIDQIVTALEGSKIAQIKCGKQHNIILTIDGKVFSYGKNTFGSLGLGGRIFQSSPRIIEKLSNKKIVSVACGLHHSLALSNIGDVYSWGRGFQGQLGLLKQVQTAASPQFIPHFFKYDNSKDAKMLRKNPIHFIACGNSHSMAIDEKGQLYCWGQARFGQTGNGKKTKQVIPKIVNLQINGQKKKAAKADGGLGHTVCLTTEGQIFSWGLNIKGQLGLNDLPEGTKSPNNQSIEYVKATYEPVLIKYARTKQVLPKFKDIACGFCRSFAIDENGNAWGWGGGALGFKDKYSERAPTKLTQGTQTKQFTKVFANQDSLVLFAPLKLLFFKPALAPSRGNTEITFFGNGFTNTGVQSVRFSYNELSQQVDLQYDDKTSTFYCKTPNFQKLKKNLTYPIECSLEVSLDKVNYYPYDKKLLIYSSKLSMESCDPKIGSAQGIGSVSIYMPLDNLTLSYIQNITVGFKNNTKNQQENRFQDWICSQGNYNNQKITCKIPNIPQFDNQNPFYMIDVSLNGQQFTDSPQTFRYYFITQTKIQPNQGPIQGQYEIKAKGKGIFDVPSKQIKLFLNFKFNDKNYQCQRQVQAKWNKADKEFVFKMPSLQWLIGDHVLSPQLLQQARKSSVLIRLHLSKLESVQLGKFVYSAPPPPPEPEEDKKDSKKDAKKGAKK